MNQSSVGGSTAKHWVFGPAMFAGAVTPFAVVAMPFLLRREGVDVDTIGAISALTTLPFAYCVAWSPVVDMFISRRNWVLLGNLASAALLAFALLTQGPDHLTRFTVLLVAGNIAYATAVTAVGGLMAVFVPDGERGHASGWYQVGSVASIPLYGGVVLWLVARTPLPVAAAAIATIAFVPVLPVLLVKEPKRSLAPSRAVLVAMFDEMKSLLKKGQTWGGLLMFLSPLGVCGTVLLLSALGTDYQVDPETVVAVTGLPGGLAMAVMGCFAGAALGTRLPRRAAYLVSGAAVGLSAGVMALLPLVPATFIVGGLVLEFLVAANSVVLWAFTLEVSGADHATAGTRTALLGAANAAAVSYMTWVAGEAHHRWGVRGICAADALLGLGAVGAIFFIGCVLRRGRDPRQRGGLTGASPR